MLSLPEELKDSWRRSRAKRRRKRYTEAEKGKRNKKKD
jgi:hypothetical protein